MQWVCGPKGWRSSQMQSLSPFSVLELAHRVHGVIGTSFIVRWTMEDEVGFLLGLDSADSGQCYPRNLETH